MCSHVRDNLAPGKQKKKKSPVGVWPSCVTPGCDAPDRQIVPTALLRSTCEREGGSRAGMNPFFNGDRVVSLHLLSDIVSQHHILLALVPGVVLLTSLRQTVCTGQAASSLWEVTEPITPEGFFSQYGFRPVSTPHFV